MADNKKSFLLYCDLIHTISKLPNEKAGELFKLILSYVNDENPDLESIDFVLQIAFEPIRQSLKRDLQKYKNIVNRNSINGSKGGRPKKPKKPSGLIGNPSKPKKADIVNDSDSVNDIVNEENKRKGVNPTFFEIEAYGKEKGYNIPVQKIIDHYTNGGDLNYWIDAKNKKVIRWKSKISSVWFKDEYKIIEKKLSLSDFKIPNADLYGWGDKKCLEMALKGEYPRK